MSNRIRASATASDYFKFRLASQVNKVGRGSTDKANAHFRSGQLRAMTHDIKFIITSQGKNAQPVNSGEVSRMSYSRKRHRSNRRPAGTSQDIILMEASRGN